MGQGYLLWSEAHPPCFLPKSHLQFCFGFEAERKEAMSEGNGAFNTVHGSEFLKQSNSAEVFKNEVQFSALRGPQSGTSVSSHSFHICSYT